MPTPIALPYPHPYPTSTLILPLPYPHPTPTLTLTSPYPYLYPYPHLTLPLSLPYPIRTDSRARGVVWDPLSLDIRYPMYSSLKYLCVKVVHACILNTIIRIHSHTQSHTLSQSPLLTNQDTINTLTTPY